MAKVAHTKHPLSFPLCRVALLFPCQDGRTPLDLAKRENKREVAALLERVLEVRLPIDRSFAFLHIDIPGIKRNQLRIPWTVRSTSRQWKLGMRRECGRSWLDTRRSVRGRMSVVWAKFTHETLISAVPPTLPMSGW